MWHGLTESVVLAVPDWRWRCVVGDVLEYVRFGSRSRRTRFRSGCSSEMDWRVLVYTLGLSVATALAFGLVPALLEARRAPAAGLLPGLASLRTDGESRGRWRARWSLARSPFHWCSS